MTAGLFLFSLKNNFPEEACSVFIAPAFTKGEGVGCEVLADIEGTDDLAPIWKNVPKSAMLNLKHSARLSCQNSASRDMDLHRPCVFTDKFLHDLGIFRH